jgi:hypothetical protein
MSRAAGVDPCRRGQCCCRHLRARGSWNGCAGAVNLRRLLSATGAGPSLPCCSYTISFQVLDCAASLHSIWKSLSHGCSQKRCGLLWQRSHLSHFFLLMLCVASKSLRMLCSHLPRRARPLSAGSRWRGGIGGGRRCLGSTHVCLTTCSSA